MYPRLDDWRARSRAVEEPQPGSELEHDVAATVGFGVPFDHLARHQLMSATQHLNLARTSVEARQIYPVAHPTVTRGALLSASRGVWLLESPDPAVRRSRGAAVVIELHKRLLEWISESNNGLVGDERQRSAADIETRLADLSARFGAAAAAARLSDTKIIEAAASAVFSDANLAGGVVALWRQLSGDAHGLLWPGMTRPSTTRVRLARDPRYPNPMMEVTGSGDLVELVNEFSAAFRILKVGWALYDERCTAPGS